MRNRLISKISLFVFVCVISKFANSQATSLQQVEDVYQSYFDGNLQEKIFVHTDRNVYIAGEIIWFKVYMAEAGSNHLIDLSRIVYVDVVDGKNQAVLRGKIKMDHGVGNGSFYLSNEIATGNFRLRAYSNWMKNFSANGFFEKPLSVINIQRPPEIQNSDTNKLNDFQFFPEGGNLVQNLESKIAFFANNNHGTGIPCSGAVVSNSRDTVLRFRSDENGMGFFKLKPAKGFSYEAIIVFVDGTQRNLKLPDVFQNGWVMNLGSAENKSVGISLFAGDTNVNEDAWLVIHNEKKVIFGVSKKFQNGKIEFAVPEDQLEGGLLTATIFNSKRQPVCERVFFQPPKNKLTFKISSDQNEYTTRKKIRINLSATDKTGSSAQPEISISIFRMDSLQNLNEPDISTYLNLQSNIVSNFQDAVNENSDKDLIDLVLLTRGWRRIRWEDVARENRTGFEFLPEYDGHIISGKVTNSKSGEAATDIFTYISSPGANLQFYVSKSDSLGRVKFYTHELFGSHELIVQTDPTQDTSLRVDIAVPFSEKYSGRALPYFQFTPALSNRIMRNSILSQVQNTYFSNSLRKFEQPDLDTVGFYGRPDYRYNLDDYTRFTTMEEVLREYVSPINVGRPAGKFHLYVIDDPRRSLFNEDPLVLLDGVPVFDMDQIMAYDPLKVRKLEVVSRKYYYGPMVNTGIASFTTYKGNLEDFHLDPRAIILDYEGLQLQREFYSPRYESESQIISRTPDFRNLLYWSPDVHFDLKGNASIEFYSSDQKGKYRMVVQGLTSNGLAGTAISTFEIR